MVATLETSLVAEEKSSGLDIGWTQKLARNVDQELLSMRRRAEALAQDTRQRVERAFLEIPHLSSTLRTWVLQWIPAPRGEVATLKTELDRLGQFAEEVQELESRLNRIERLLPSSTKRPSSTTSSAKNGRRSSPRQPSRRQ